MPATRQALENPDLHVYTKQLERLDDLLDTFLDEDQRQFFIVRAHRYGVPIYEYCGGTSTKAYSIQQDTISCVFSITKAITSTLVMMLQEGGLLDISESVSTYLDCFSGKENIQIWHLMTHTSGISDEDFKAFRENCLKEWGLLIPTNDALDDVKKEFKKQLNIKLELPENADENARYCRFFSLYQPAKQPRDIMLYSNTGYFFLGLLIEKVSGMSLNDYSRMVLFEPLQMTDSFYSLPSDRFHRVAGRNERCLSHEWINSEDNFRWPGAMGGLKTTVIDLCRFGDMLLGCGTLDGVRILSPASIHEMRQDHNKNIKNPADMDSWGLGFNLRSTKKDDAGVLRSAASLEHGGMCGHKFLADPEYSVTIAIFTGEYDTPGKNVFYPINNVIISALDNKNNE